MTNETMKDGERAAFEVWAKGRYAIAHFRSGEYKSVDTQAAWEAWQARAASLQSGELDVGVLARLSAEIFGCPLTSHGVKFARAIEAHVRASAPQAALTDEQIIAICRNHFANCYVDATPSAWIGLARGLLATAPTERMSDAANDPKDRTIAFLRDQNRRIIEASDRVHVDAERYRWLRKQLWNESSIFVVACHRSAVRLGTDCPSVERLDEAIDTARKAEIESARSAGGEA